MKFSLLKWSYLYFIIAALLGLLMRLNSMGISFTAYDHLLHTHSHIAFLGWIYTSLFILLLHFFLEKKDIEKYHFKKQWIITHILVLGMLIAFILQGYALYSILISSMFQLMTYWYVFSVFKALKQQHLASQTSTVAGLFLKYALWSLLLSSLGPWALPVIKSMQFGNSVYNATIYFYMHFLFNGWILFALLAIFFKTLDTHPGICASKDAKRFLLYMVYALLPGYFLSLLGILKNPLTFSLAALAAILQLQALFYFIRLLYRNRKEIINVNTAGQTSKIFLCVVIISFSIKIFLQLFSIIPDLADLAFNNRGIIISYLHLVMLGIFSSYLIHLFMRQKILSLDSVTAKFSSWLFITSFILIEIILGFQFTGIEAFYAPGNIVFLTGSLLLSILLIPLGFKTTRQP